MFELILFLVIILPIVLTIINIILGSRKKRLITIIVTSIVLTIFVFIVLINVFYSHKIDKDRNDYLISSGSILSGIYYVSTDDNYHYVNNSYLFGVDSYAIPIETCELSPLSRISNDVYLYYERDSTKEYERIIGKDGYSYELRNDIVRIEPNFWSLGFAYAVCGTIFLALFNIIMFILILVQRHKDKQQ